MKEFNMLAKTYFGLEDILAKELTELGANEIETERRAVRFKGDKALLYKANLCLRSAIRILVPIAQFKATDADEVYEKAKKINWEEYIGIKQSFIINETVNSENFRHSKFVAYRLKETKTATLIFPGETEPTTKAYKCNESIEFSAGMRVKIAKISGTYVVEYPISGMQSGSSETPELANMANRVKNTGSTGSIYFRIYNNVLQYRLNANGTWKSV